MLREHIEMAQVLFDQLDCRRAVCRSKRQTPPDLRTVVPDDFLEIAVEILFGQRLGIRWFGLLRVFGDLAVVVRGCV